MKKKSLILLLCFSLLLTGCNGGKTSSGSEAEKPAATTPAVTSQSTSDDTSSDIGIAKTEWTGSQYESPVNQGKFETLVTRVATKLQQQGIVVVGAEGASSVEALNITEVDMSVLDGISITSTIAVPEEPAFESEELTAQYTAITTARTTITEKTSELEELRSKLADLKEAAEKSAESSGDAATETTGTEAPAGDDATEGAETAGTASVADVEKAIADAKAAITEAENAIEQAELQIFTLTKAHYSEELAKATGEEHKAEYTDDERAALEAKLSQAITDLNLKTMIAGKAGSDIRTAKAALTDLQSIDTSKMTEEELEAHNVKIKKAEQNIVFTQLSLEKTILTDQQKTLSTEIKGITDASAKAKKQEELDKLKAIIKAKGYQVNDANPKNLSDKDGYWNLNVGAYTPDGLAKWTESALRYAGDASHNWKTPKKGNYVSSDYYLSYKQALLGADGAWFNATQIGAVCQTGNVTADDFAKSHTGGNVIDFSQLMQAAYTGAVYSVTIPTMEEIKNSEAYKDMYKVDSKYATNGYEDWQRNDPRNVYLVRGTNKDEVYLGSNVDVENINATLGSDVIKLDFSNEDDLSALSSFSFFDLDSSKMQNTALNWGIGGYSFGVGQIFHGSDYVYTPVSKASSMYYGVNDKNFIYLPATSGELVPSPYIRFFNTLYTEAIENGTYVNLRDYIQHNMDITVKQPGTKDGKWHSNLFEALQDKYARDEVIEVSPDVDHFAQDYFNLVATCGTAAGKAWDKQWAEEIKKAEEAKKAEEDAKKAAEAAESVTESGAESEADTATPTAPDTTSPTSDTASASETSAPDVAGTSLISGITTSTDEDEAPLDILAIAEDAVQLEEMRTLAVNTSGFETFVKSFKKLVTEYEGEDNANVGYRGWQDIVKIADLENMTYAEFAEKFCEGGSGSVSDYGVAFNVGESGTLIRGDSKTSYDWVLQIPIVSGCITIDELRDTILNYVVMVGALTNVDYSKALDITASGLINKEVYNNCAFTMDFFSNVAIMGISRG